MVKKKGTVKVKQTESAKEEGSKKIPVGVQIISVFYYICAALCVLLGLFLTLGASAIVSLLVESTPELESFLTGGVIVGLGVVVIGAGLLCFCIGRGLWKLKAWAKILAMILSAIGLIFIVYSMIKGFAFLQVVRFAINAAILIYLIFAKEAKGAFK